MKTLFKDELITAGQPAQIRCIQRELEIYPKTVDAGISSRGGVLWGDQSLFSQ